MTDNELIARFMGCPEQDGYFGIHEDSQAVRWWDRYSTKSICLDDDYTVYYAFKPEDMLYDTSFDWLMPVVEKVESLSDCNFSISNNCVNHGWAQFRADTKIKAVYKAVLNFIKDYNNGNK